MITRISEGKLKHLADALTANDSVDPCACSPAYFALTGRHGLWLLQQPGAAAVLCRHPNDPDQLLAFPPFGPDAESLRRRLPAHAVMARVPANAFVSPDHIATPEPLLDWRYPVHTLDIHQVAKLPGPGFRKLRQTVRQVHRQGVRIRPLTRADRAEALHQVRRWADAQRQTLSMQELIAPYARVFQLMNAPALDIRGVAFTHGAKLVGFYVWEHPSPGKTAVGLTAWTSRDIRGLAEFQHVVMCKLLAQLGVDRLCLGGAETSGLDAFKRKFRPVQSLQLVTHAPLIASDVQDIAA